MYQICHRNNCWHILRGNEVILFGIGSVETAITIGRLYGYFLTFENEESKKAA